MKVLLWMFPEAGKKYFFKNYNRASVILPNRKQLFAKIIQLSSISPQLYNVAGIWLFAHIILVLKVY
jgi:hypothetical protein